MLDYWKTKIERQIGGAIKANVPNERVFEKNPWIKDNQEYVDYANSFRPQRTRVLLMEPTPKFIDKNYIKNRDEVLRPQYNEMLKSESDTLADMEFVANRQGENVNPQDDLRQKTIDRRRQLEESDVYFQNKWKSEDEQFSTYGGTTPTPESRPDFSEDTYGGEQAGYYLASTLDIIPAMSRGLASAGAGIVQGGNVVANKITGDNTPMGDIQQKLYDTFVEASEQPWLTYTRDIKEESAQYLADKAMALGGKTGKATSQMSNIVFDTLQQLAVLKGAKIGYGSSPSGLAGKQFTGRLANAQKIATFKYLTTEANPNSDVPVWKQKSDAYLTTAAYMSTPAISGFMQNPIGAKTVDFALNTLVSLKGGAYRDSINNAGQQAIAEGRPQDAMFEKILEASTVFGMDVVFSAITKPYAKSGLPAIPDEVRQSFKHFENEGKTVNQQLEREFSEKRTEMIKRAKKGDVEAKEWLRQILGLPSVTVKEEGAVKVMDDVPFKTVEQEQQQADLDKQFNPDNPQYGKVETVAQEPVKTVEEPVQDVAVKEIIPKEDKTAVKDVKTVSKPVLSEKTGVKQPVTAPKTAVKPVSSEKKYKINVAQLKKRRAKQKRTLETKKDREQLKWLKRNVEERTARLNRMKGKTPLDIKMKKEGQVRLRSDADDIIEIEARLKAYDEKKVSISARKSMTKLEAFKQIGQIQATDLNEVAGKIEVKSKTVAESIKTKKQMKIERVRLLNEAQNDLYNGSNPKHKIGDIVELNRQGKKNLVVLEQADFKISLSMQNLAESGSSISMIFDGVQGAILESDKKSEIGTTTEVYSSDIVNGEKLSNTLDYDPAILFKQLEKQSVTAPKTAVEAVLSEKRPGTENYQNKVNQVIGKKNKITTPTGETVNGQYKVVAGEDLTASHNNDNFAPNPDFPVDENGDTINDRDYRTDKVAQAEVISMGKDFDSRAVQNIPVVSEDGIVLSGNNRIMSRNLAGDQKTDSKYIEALKTEAESRGIDTTKIDEMLKNGQKPTLVFESSDKLANTTETLSMFNKPEGKGKSSLGKSVEISKIINKKPLLKKRIGDLFNKAEKPSDVTGTPQIARKLRKVMLDSGLIQENELNTYYNSETEIFTPAGKNLIENTVLGMAFDSTTLERMESEGMRSLKRKFLQAIVPLAKNVSMDAKNSLKAEFNKVIDVLNTINKNGETIEQHQAQVNMFSDERLSDAEMFLLKKLDDKGFKNWLVEYNKNVGQADLFKGGEKTTKTELLNKTSFLDKIEAEAREEIKTLTPAELKNLRAKRTRLKRKLVLESKKLEQMERSKDIPIRVKTDKQETVQGLSDEIGSITGQIDASVKAKTAVLDEKDFDVSGIGGMINTPTETFAESSYKILEQELRDKGGFVQIRKDSNEIVEKISKDNVQEPTIDLHRVSIAQFQKAVEDFSGAQNWLFEKVKNAYDNRRRLLSKQSWEKIGLWMTYRNNPELVKKYYDKVPKRIQKLLDDMKNLTNDEKAQAEILRQEWDTWKTKLEKEGRSVLVDKEYVTQITRKLNVERHGAGKKGFGKKSAFEKQRRFRDGVLEVYATEGYEPVTIEASKLMRIYQEAAVKSRTEKAFVKVLMGLVNENGEKLLIPANMIPKGDRNKYTFVDNPSFTVKRGSTISRADNTEGSKDVFYKGKSRNQDAEIAKQEQEVLIDDMPLLVHKSAAKRLNTLLATSGLKGDPIFGTLLKANAIGKYSLLSFSGFHHMALWKTGVFYGAGIPLISHKKGLRLITNNDPIVMGLVKNGLTLGTSSKLYFAREVANEGLRGITQVGKSNNPLIKTMLAPIRGIADVVLPAKKWWDTGLWDHYYVGLKSISAKLEQLRNIKRYEKELSNGSMIMDDVYKITARDMNANFGGMNWRIMKGVKNEGVSETTLDAMRLLLLAPDWTTSNWQLFGNAAKVSTAYKALSENNQLPSFDEAGNVTGWRTPPANTEKGASRYMMKVIGTIGIGTMVANMLMNGRIRPTDDDRWSMIELPNDLFFDEFGRAYYLDAFGHFFEPVRAFTDPGRWLNGKKSFLAGAMQEAIQGKNWRGDYIGGVNEMITLLPGGEKANMYRSKYKDTPGGWERLPLTAIHTVLKGVPIPLRAFGDYLAEEKTGAEAVSILGGFPIRRGKAFGWVKNESDRRSLSIKQGKKLKKLREEYKDDPTKLSTELIKEKDKVLELKKKGEKATIDAYSKVKKPSSSRRTRTR